MGEPSLSSRFTKRRRTWLARLGRVLARGWRVDDRRIDQRARAQRDPVIGQVTVHLGEQLFGQLMPLQQVAEVEDRRLVGNTVITQFDAREAAHGVAVIQHFFGHRVAESVPLLQEVDPQHRLQWHRRSPTLRSHLRIMRRDQRQQPRPRHHRVHLGKEFLPPRLLFLHRMSEAGKGRPLGHRQGSSVVPASLPQAAQHARFFRPSLGSSGCSSE